ncbi:hypothetical protein E3N88_33212 [Mikania micrantha]|uniref:Integrase catalytic domain-containing protein n=1 Tax=Mikania micrantha TaxID=192012 RepID=A0A5N6MB64_9ASTR|nr:hypothetical protein E3N88_33212 [Mikania micrantha]
MADKEAPPNQLAMVDRSIKSHSRTAVDPKKDNAAIALLYQALPEDLVIQVAYCERAAEIWETIKTRHVGVERVMEARLHTRQSFPSQSSFRSKTLLEQAYVDLCGPITPATSARNRYILLFVDDHSRFMRPYMLKTKDEALEKFKTFKAPVENHPESTVSGRGPMLPESATRVYGDSDPSIAEGETYDGTPPQG